MILILKLKIILNEESKVNVILKPNQFVFKWTELSLFLSLNGVLTWKLLYFINYGLTSLSPEREIIPEIPNPRRTIQERPYRLIRPMLGADNRNLPTVI